MNQLELAAALDKERGQRKWTRQKLAEKAGLSRSAVTDVLTGKDVRASSLIAVAFALEHDILAVPTFAARAIQAGPTADKPRVQSVAVAALERVQNARRAMEGKGG